MKKAFTLIEILIVITVIGILSTLLFRTLGDMVTTNARIQQEKTMTQELITLQTTLNNISEHYPHIDYEQYKRIANTNAHSGYIGDNNNGVTTDLYLSSGTGESKRTAHIYGSGTNGTAYLEAVVQSGSNKQTIQITNPDASVLSGVAFKLLPTIRYTSGTIYDHMDLDKVNAQGYRIFGNLSIKSKPLLGQRKSSYSLQHFIHLQQ